MVYKIKPEERGHRPPLSGSEKTVSYTIKMPLSLKQRCVRWGANLVRKILKDWAKKEDVETGFKSSNKQSVPCSLCGGSGFMNNKQIKVMRANGFKV